MHTQTHFRALTHTHTNRARKSCPERQCCIGFSSGSAAPPKLWSDERRRAESIGSEHSCITENLHVVFLNLQPLKGTRDGLCDLYSGATNIYAFFFIMLFLAGATYSPSNTVCTLSSGTHSGGSRRAKSCDNLTVG